MLDKRVDYSGWSVIVIGLITWDVYAQVIQSYGSSLSAYGLFFLGAHFVWAFCLMFLFSGRGY